MAEPIAFDIALRGSVWVLTRDGQEVHAFSHVDRATHEAVRLARELEESGQPARVQVLAAEGKVIEVRLDPEPDRSDGPEGGDRSLV